MRNNKLDYVQVIYDDEKKPLTSYPYHLTKYIFERYKLKKESKNT